MEYRKLPLSCECGAVPKRILTVGLSTTHDLVIHWLCPRCRRHVYIVKPLADCWRECPTEASADLSNSKVIMDTPADRRFLHSLGVTFQDE